MSYVEKGVEMFADYVQGFERIGWTVRTLNEGHAVLIDKEKKSVFVNLSFYKLQDGFVDICVDFSDKDIPKVVLGRMDKTGNLLIL